MARVMTAKEVFDLMPSRFLPEQVGDLNATFQFDLSGEGGGQWYVTIADQQLTVVEGTAPAPNLTLSTSAEDYVAIVNGDLNAMSAFMQGKVKAKGDMALAMRMQTLFKSS